MAERILILGVGNILLGDEGFGAHAVQYLQAHYQWPDNVKLVEGGTLGLLLLGELMECDLAVILDVAYGGHAPGVFYRIEEDALNTGFCLNQSLHQTSIPDLLISCDLAGHRPKAIVFAMEPYDIQTPRAGLTPQAAQKLPEFCAKVVEQIGEIYACPICQRAF